MLREIELRRTDPTRSFIHVLKIAETPHLVSNFLGTYGFRNLIIAKDRDRELTELMATLRLPTATTAASARRVSSVTAVTKFRNREDELRKVVHGLTNAGGPHFWLITAPPELGKTWFLNQLSENVQKDEPEGWVTRLVDLGERSPDILTRPGEILAGLLGLDWAPDDQPETLRDLAQRISIGGMSYLCLLDSAEQLPEETISALRSRLSRIYGFVEETGAIDVRLTLVVASRRDDKWRWIAPEPRLEPLSLTEFSPNVVVHALTDMADQTKHRFGPMYFQRKGELVHCLSEGLPALLVGCLQWIHEAQWLELDQRLASQDLFKKLATPYIEGKLLSHDSLMPGMNEPSSVASQLLKKALWAVVPYRFFTLSHLHHHLDTDDDFQRGMEYLRWHPEDLWTVISGTALLKRPLHEPWQKLHDAIRRILYKHFYSTTEERIASHREAHAFMKIWADKQTGTEQLMGIVECLWHEAEVLRMEKSSETAAVLMESARKLAQALQSSSAYTIRELQASTIERMQVDKEFQDSIKHIDGLMDSLAHIIATAQDT